ncbi:ankyrin repeat domain-containing protein [Maricaulis maris]|nr:ankyrin repeat domain-containing protein [Maricaulis maris]
MTDYKDFQDALAKQDYDALASAIATISDLDAMDSFGWTPLIYATLRDDVKAIEMLLASGCSLGACDLGGLTAFDHADLNGNQEVRSRLSG